MDWAPEALSMGELLLGFFDFFANDFDWGSAPPLEQHCTYGGLRKM